MSEFTFECPSCGAPLKPDGDNAEVTCKFCGAVVVVPEALRDRPPAPPPQHTPTYQMPPQVVIIEQFEHDQQPQLAREQVVYPVRRRRRSGCGCVPLIILLMLVALLLAVMYSTRPEMFNRIVALVSNAASSVSIPPIITQFTADPNPASPGAGVIVRWSSNADQVRLERREKGQLVQNIASLPGSGSRLITLAADSGDVALRLVAIKGDQDASRQLTITVRRR